MCVAKLDRLSRNVEFLAKVMNSNAEFVACDNPAANRLTLHILAAVAEAEAKAISDRTKAALAAAKKRGIKLGSARPGIGMAGKGAVWLGPEPAPRLPVLLWLMQRRKPTAICGQSWPIFDNGAFPSELLPTS